MRLTAAFFAVLLLTVNPIEVSLILGFSTHALFVLFLLQLNDKACYVSLPLLVPPYRFRKFCIAFCIL